MKSWSRSEKAIFAAILLFAALIRGLYLLTYSHSMWWSELIVDSLYHVRWADSIAGGNVLGDDVYFRAPLYTYILALIHYCFTDSILAPRLFGSILGVFSIAVTYHIGRVIGGPRRGPFIAAAAALMQALYPSAIFQEAELMGDFFYAFLIQLAVWQVVVFDQRRLIRSSVIVGALVGLAAITRPTILALAPLLLFLVWRRAGIGKMRLRAAIVAAGATIAVIAPVTIRNYFVGKDFVVVASSGGINFYIGNNPAASPVDAAMPEPLGATWRMADMRGIAELNLGRELSASEISAYWQNEAWKWIVSHPLEFAKAYARKFYVLLGNTPYSNNLPLDVMYHANPILRFSFMDFTFLLCWSVVGFYWLRQNNLAGVGVLATIALAHALVMCLFFVNERFRLPSILLLFPLAGAGVSYFIEVCRQLYFSNNVRPQNIRSGQPFVALAMGGAVAIISFIPAGRPHENGAARESYLVGNTKMAGGKYSDAIAAFSKTMRLDPAYSRAALNTGVAYFRMGIADSAERYFRRELRFHPGVADALGNLASLRLTRGDVAAADQFSAMALEAMPYDLTTVRIRLRSLAAIRDSSRTAERIIRGASPLHGADARFWYEAGSTLLHLGKSDSAREYFARGAMLPMVADDAIETSDAGFERTSSVASDRRRATMMCAYQAGYLNGISGDFRKSAKFSSMAISNDSTFVESYINLINAYLSLRIMDSAKSVYLLAKKRFGADAKVTKLLAPYAPLEKITP